jgi:hypothetical protein
MKRLRSVVHSIAHHAISGLCYVHPHLGQARKRLGVKDASVDLLRPEISLVIDPIPREIALSTEALRERFAALIAGERLNIAEIKSAEAVFVYRGTCTWPDACYVQVETIEGKRIEDAVGHDGRRAQILRASKRLQSTRSRQRAPEA